MLELQEYQQVVELNNKLLKKHKGNIQCVSVKDGVCGREGLQRVYFDIEMEHEYINICIFSPHAASLLSF